MDPATQDRLQDKLEDLVDYAAGQGVSATDFRKWISAEAEYQIQTREEDGEFS